MPSALTSKHVGLRLMTQRNAGNPDLEPTSHYVVRETYKYSSPLFFHGLSPIFLFFLRSIPPGLSLAPIFPALFFTRIVFDASSAGSAGEKLIRNKQKQKQKRIGMKKLEKLNLMLECRNFLTVCYTFLQFNFND